MLRLANSPNKPELLTNREHFTSDYGHEGRVGVLIFQGYLKYIHYLSLLLKYLLSTTDSTPQISLEGKRNKQKTLLSGANTPSVSSLAATPASPHPLGGTESAHSRQTHL